MIVDGRGGAEVRFRESHEDRRPGEYESRSHGRASGTPSQSQVCESSLCPSACFYEDPLQVKRVTSCCCPVLGATEGLDERMAVLHMLTRIS
jgi:hypothetical protein